jgi:hypothetical protein
VIADNPAVEGDEETALEAAAMDSAPTDVGRCPGCRRPTDGTGPRRRSVPGHWSGP